jgi:hypothetical protein
MRISMRASAQMLQEVVPVLINLSQVPDLLRFASTCPELQLQLYLVLTHNVILGQDANDADDGGLELCSCRVRHQFTKTRILYVAFVWMIDAS